MTREILFIDIKYLRKAMSGSINVTDLYLSAKCYLVNAGICMHGFTASILYIADFLKTSID